MSYKVVPHFQSLETQRTIIKLKVNKPSPDYSLRDAHVNALTINDKKVDIWSESNRKFLKLIKRMQEKVRITRPSIGFGALPWTIDQIFTNFYTGTSISL